MIYTLNGKLINWYINCCFIHLLKWEKNNNRNDAHAVHLYNVFCKYILFESIDELKKTIINMIIDIILINIYNFKVYY